MKTSSLLLVTLLGMSPTAAQSGGIAWFGTWERGHAEAQRSGRPILLVSAAPHCHEVSGLW